MKVDESKLSVANLRDMLARGDLVSNIGYQRSPGLWPNASRSYFIDTILEGYPFPKIYFHEFLDRKTKKVRTEIVDGQQRITTIQDFLSNKFALGKNSSNFQGKRFEDLDEEVQDKFLFYTISTDVIRDASYSEILQMFRRMNAYTLPLNAAEKRHSEFFGEFKDLVTRVLDHNHLLYEWGVFTTRQIVRMNDATFIADLVLAMDEGVVSTSDAKLNSIYKKYDTTFPQSDRVESELGTVFNTISQEFSPVRDSYFTKPHAMHALFCAIYHNMYGLPNFEAKTGIPTIGRASTCPQDRAVGNLLELAAAHESKDMSRFPEYVDAMSGGTNRERQRTDRIVYICRALRDEL
ncbi:DUF262 domain-containing protein [Pseudomonas putida]|uniref:DUF262 domain-containing protein n=1 Tax=Pseudomonas TaxID=286 RepID=UPI001AAE403B|nr:MULTISPECIES: DUF262 domain-containing protein [Pseudomonas]MBO2925000.1 DUF262 domain-containing protein [Pseudomonas asiatica]MDD2038752.1 DUF262 domain-containing protein [Pseudomonas putida]MDD2044303.1 DUF262 domain-containing protein [Pseudomonas putida]